jgi:hypothetical protein
MAISLSRPLGGVPQQKLGLNVVNRMLDPNFAKAVCQDFRLFVTTAGIMLVLHVLNVAGIIVLEQTFVDLTHQILISTRALRLSFLVYAPRPVL